MKIPFYKYQGTGNDFVMIDNRETKYLTRQDIDKVKWLCDRRFGVGADGLILLENHPDYDFEMIYFNADGNESTMCGNGGRCITAFAKYLGIFEKEATFIAIDGLHLAKIDDEGIVSVKMIDVPEVEQGEDYFLLDTGSPHYIIFVEDIDDIDVVQNGQAIRYSKRFRAEGVNVNFVEKTPEGIIVATYERGVEDETLSCGTGVTASAIAYQLQSKNQGTQKVDIESKGGNLAVSVHIDTDQKASDVWLCGPAVQVFCGEIRISNFH